MIEIEPNIATIEAFLRGQDDAALYRAADDQRRRIFGEEVYIRGIVEFSNYCRQNCLYCGLRAGNRKIPRYRLSREEILECVDQIQERNVSTIVLQSGEDPFYSAADISELLHVIRRRYSGAITLSLGEWDFRAYEQWRAAGADRYLLRLETFNREHYPQIRPNCSWEARRTCLDNLRKLDFEIGSGIMVGIPGETATDIARAVIALSELKLDMIGLGPFVRHAQTPYRDRADGDAELSLRTLALIRLLNPYANIPATSALDSARPGSRIRGLQVGANVIMPSFTPPRVNRLYSIYPGKNVYEDPSIDGFEMTMKYILEAGYIASFERGDSPLFRKRIECTINR